LIPEARSQNSETGNQKFWLLTFWILVSASRTPKLLVDGRDMHGHDEVIG